MKKSVCFAIALVLSAPAFAAPASEPVPNPSKEAIIIVQDGDRFGFRHCLPGNDYCGQIGVKEFYSRAELKKKHDRAVVRSHSGLSPVLPLGILGLTVGASATQYRNLVVAKNPRHFGSECLPSLKGIFGDLVFIASDRLSRLAEVAFNPSVSDREAALMREVLKTQTNSTRPLSVDRKELEMLLDESI